MTLAAEYFTLSVAHGGQASAEDRRFRPMGGLQIKSLQFQASPLERLDFTSHWRHLAGQNSGVRMRISGNGILAGAASDHFLAHLFLTNQQAACRIDMPDFGRFSGPFLITELAYEARQDEEVSWRIGLQSAADIRFDPAAMEQNHASI